MARLTRFIERYENMPMGFGLWLSVALFIIFVRDGIECVISTQGFAVADAFHLLHVPVFFISLLLFLIVILHFFAKTGIQKVSKIALAPFSIIAFPVLLDLIFTHFTKAKITYYYIEDNFWLSFLRFFDPTYAIPELPRSIRLEITLVTLMAFGYIFLKRKKVLPPFLGALSIYLLCFLYVSVPAVLIELVKLLSFVINILHLKSFPLPEGVIDEGVLVLLELLLASFLALIWLWRWDPKKCRAVIKNMRPTRSLHYILLCLLGVLIHCIDTPIKDFFMLIRILGGLLAVFFAFQFSVCLNDIFDVDCDRISNANRPLITGALDKREYLNIGYVYLALSLLFAYWVNETCVMIVLLFIALYFLYSAPPLHLKRFFPISALILGLQALLAFATGEASLSSNEAAISFHTSFFWPIFVIFSLSSNIKDLKDVKGDRQTGVATLPVLLGERTGRNIIAFLVSLSYCLVPYFLHHLFPRSKILVLTLCFALASFFYIRRKDAREGIIFLIYFIYVIFLLLVVR